VRRSNCERTAAAETEKGYKTTCRRTLARMPCIIESVELRLRLLVQPSPSPAAYATARMLLLYSGRFDRNTRGKMHWMLAAQLGARRTGRRQSWVPLLIALDGICRLGASHRPRGRRPTERSGRPLRDEVVRDLAHDWRKSADSIRQYLKDSQQPQHYFRRARQILSHLRRRRFAWGEIALAVAEHCPWNRHVTYTLATGGFEFNLVPVAPRVHRPTTRDLPRASRRRSKAKHKRSADPASEPRRKLTVEEHLAPIRAATERAPKQKRAHR
jgi:hypothetical protein